METRSAARERDAAGARDAPVSSSPTEMDVGGMDASTFRPASPPRRASVSGAPRNENAGGSAGTSATARDTDADRQDVIPWSNADPTRRVRTARHLRPIPRPTRLPRAPPRTEPHVSKASRPLVSLPLPSRRVIPRFRLAHLTDSSDARVFSSKFRLRLGALSSLSFSLHCKKKRKRVSSAPSPHFEAMLHTGDRGSDFCKTRKGTLRRFAETEVVTLSRRVTRTRARTTFARSDPPRNPKPRTSLAKIVHASKWPPPSRSAREPSAT